MATPSWTRTRPPTCSTRRLAGRSAWCSTISAAAICTTRSASSRDAPKTYIEARADAERQRWMKKAQVTAEKTAWLEIITHGQSHLSSPKARARYDRTLAQEAEESFEGLAEFALKGLSRLDPGTSMRLIEEAAGGRDPLRAGRSPDRPDLPAVGCARASDAHCCDYGAPLPPSPPRGPCQWRGQVQRAALPALCGGDRVEPGGTEGRAPHAAGTAGRRSSGIARSASERPGSTNGGATAGFARRCASPWCRHFEAAQKAFRNFDLDGALEHLARVQAFAPNLAGARNGIAKIRQRQADITRVQLAYETARAGGRLVSARGAVEAWSRLVDPESPDLQAAWSEAGAGASPGRVAGGSGPEPGAERSSAARDLYRQSLAIAADLPDALTGLKRTPPDPPTAPRWPGLRRSYPALLDAPASRRPGLAHLRHRPQAGRRCSMHPGDGTRIAEVSTSEFDDMHVTPGDTRRLRRTEQARRGRVGHRDLARPVRFPGRRQGRAGRTSPTRGRAGLDAAAWRVGRSGDPQARAGRPGTPATATASRPRSTMRSTATSIRMRSTTTGSTPSTRCPTAGCVPSPGVVVSARPQPPVSALEAPGCCWNRDGRVRIDWIEPVRGSVKILRTAHPLPHPAGTRLATGRSRGLEGHWIEPAAPDRAYDLEPPAEGHCYYTPLTVWGGNLHRWPRRGPQPRRRPVRAAATRAGTGLGPASGDTRRHAPLAVGCGGERVPGRRPPGHASAGPERSRRRPGDRSPSRLRSPGLLDAQLAIGSRSPELRSQYLPLHPISRRTPAADPTAQADAGPWHIRVYSLIDLDGVRSISPGLEPTAAMVLPGPNPEVTVSYVLKRPWLPGLPWSVTFRTEPPGSTVPPMVLVAHPARFPSRSTTARSSRISRPAATDPTSRPHAIELSQHGARVFPDPHVEPDALTPIRLRHPESGRTLGLIDVRERMCACIPAICTFCDSVCSLIYQARATPGAG